MPDDPSWPSYGGGVGEELFSLFLEAVCDDVVVVVPCGVVVPVGVVSGRASGVASVVGVIR